MPKKNIKLFHGKPIIAYSIENAKDSGLFDVVAVSTDDNEIRDIALGYGASVVNRKRSDGTIGTQEETARALAQYGHFEYACCLYATAPLLDINDLRRGLYAVEHSSLFAMGVATDPLRDAGQFYFGRTESFTRGVPLIGPDTAMIPITKDRVCDINTIEDFELAKQMYEALHE